MSVRSNGILASLREFVFGMTGYEFVRHAAELRGSLETLFMVNVVGDMIGLPVIPPYYALRLMPYLVPHVTAWRRRVLREREVTEDHDFDLHGI